MNNFHRIIWYHKCVCGILLRKLKKYSKYTMKTCQENLWHIYMMGYFNWVIGWRMQGWLKGQSHILKTAIMVPRKRLSRAIPLHSDPAGDGRCNTEKQKLGGKHISGLVQDCSNFIANTLILHCSLALSYHYLTLWSALRLLMVNLCNLLRHLLAQWCFSRNSIWKCHHQNFSHFIQASGLMPNWDNV